MSEKADKFLLFLAGASVQATFARIVANRASPPFDLDDDATKEQVLTAIEAAIAVNDAIESIDEVGAEKALEAADIAVHEMRAAMSQIPGRQYFDLTVCDDATDVTTEEILSAKEWPIG